MLPHLRAITPFIRQGSNAIMALAGIGKTNKKFATFINSALFTGYGADQILDYIRDAVESRSTKNERERLTRKSQTVGLDPLDQEALSEAESGQRFTRRLGALTGIGYGISSAASSSFDAPKEKAQPPAFDLPRKLGESFSRYPQILDTIEGLMSVKVPLNTIVGAIRNRNPKEYQALERELGMPLEEAINVLWSKGKRAPNLARQDQMNTDLSRQLDDLEGLFR